jgi:O-antigen ligase
MTIMKYLIQKFLDINAKFDYILMISLFASVLLVLGVVKDFKTLTFFSLILCTFFYLKKRKILTAVLLTSIFLLPFFSPNKYYLVEVIHGSEIFDTSFRAEGYLLGFGINIINLFSALSVLLFFREVVLKKIDLKLKQTLGVITFSAAGFILVGIGSSITHSPFLLTSLVWLAQYSQLFIFALLIFYILVSNIKEVNSFYSVILSSILLQFSLAFLQFFRQSFLGLAIENVTGTWFAVGLDENNAVLRPAGSLAFHNEFALVMLLYLIIILPISLRERKQEYLLGISLAFLSIILSQSRSIWIATSIVLLLTMFTYFKHVKRIAVSIGKKRLILYSSLAIISLSYIIFPRILLSFNSFYEGAGIPFRIQLMTEGVQAFIQNPWLGYGIGTNEYVLHSLFPNGVMSFYPTAVHFGLLQMALEIGVMGTVFFLFPFFYIVRKIILLKINKTKVNIIRSDFQFIFISSSAAIFIYYLFLPHVGIIEFSYLGLIIGFGLSGIVEMKKKYVKKVS